MVFPGQGSQSQGMQTDLAEKFSVVRDVYAEASEVLGYDLWTLVQEGPAEKLGETTVTQPAMLTAGYAAYRAWIVSDGEPARQMAGHSLGEYTALVCAGALSFADAVSLVKIRSELMQSAVPVRTGAMAAILGLDDAAVIEICRAASGGGVVEAVNFNSPGQVVIAGQTESVNTAVASAKEQGARRAIVLPVSVPAHSTLMQSAGEKLAEALANTTFSAPGVSVVAAADAIPYDNADDIRHRLAIQVHSPVQWVDTINALVSGGATRIIECGPGKVLAGLVRRINKGTAVSFIDNVDSLDKALEA